MGIHGARWLSTKKGCSSFMAHPPSCGPDHMSLGTLGQAMAMFSVSSCFQLETTNTPWDGGAGDESPRLQISWTTRDLSSWPVTQTVPILPTVEPAFVFPTDQPARRSVSCFTCSRVLSSPTDTKRCPCLQKPSPGPVP